MLKLRASIVTFVKHLIRTASEPTPDDEEGKYEEGESISNQMVLVLHAVKGLYTEAVEKEALAIPVDKMQVEVARLWYEVRAYIDPEALVNEHKFKQPLEVSLDNLRSPAMDNVLKSIDRALCTVNPGSEPINAEAKRQLLFFGNSLFNTTMEKPPPVSRMKSWSAFTPHYAEDVTYSVRQLQGVADEDATLHRLLISLFPDEWENFCERMVILPRIQMSDLPRHKVDGVCRWASDRAQVLSRTVRGMLRYADALRVLARLEGVPEDDVEMVVASKFEFVVTCQIYGKLKFGLNGKPPSADDKQKAESIDALRKQFARNLRVAYVDQAKDENGKDEFYSVLLGVDPQTFEDRVLFKVKLPGNPILGEGKPENQNQAIIFTRGEHLQTLDMNQDNYLGESYKMRNLLESFYGKVRIVGFREHIFSESGGAVAHFAASNELVFGTMVQRFLAWPLRVRFHYGHPDVWDKVWAFSSGGVSKASRTLHVSEDIFGGLNAVLRGGEVEYEEYIHCGKARDITFTAANAFEQKVSGGNAFQGLSRDFYRAGKSFDLFRLLSLYNTGTGLFASSTIMFWALYWFTLTIACLALIGLENFTVDTQGNLYTDLGRGGAQGDTQVYSAEWLIQLGFIMIWPLFLEYWGMSGLLGALKEVARQFISLKILFTVFVERTRAYYLHQGLILGSARYIATGRSFTSMSSNFLQLYTLYV